MKLNIQEIRKQSEGLHFEQTLDLAADLRARNQEILDVKISLQLEKYSTKTVCISWTINYLIPLFLLQVAVWSQLS